ncbi:tetratricopeptide repeat protein [Fundidesulfovibrio soli]|uniref:tetratricopeptide repeat protein n=1 Tax=Fundidesulfovibrio soli TaxID=2922716 RepID=UPI001FAF68BD|nr:tetratricopeptide repeat protein [Fundidesulfovibrio soli]
MFRYAFVIALALGLAACAPKKPAPADVTERGLSPQAAADYYFLIYQDLSRKGQPQQGAAVLEKIIELAPTPELYRDLANIYWGMAQPDKTREVLERGLAVYPEDKTLHFYMANSFLLQRRYDEAMAVLRKYLAAHPKDQTASQELASIMVGAGKNQEALDFMASLPKERRTPAMAYYESKAYNAMGKQKQATEKLRQALREDPNQMAAWSELAFQYEKAGDFKQAEEAYRRILDLGEDSPELWIRLIRLALKQKKPDKALALLEKAPNDRSFLFEVMGIFVDAGYQNAAAQVLDKLSQDQPDNPDVLFIQAMLAVEKENNLDKAFELLSRIPKDNKLYDKALSTRIQLAIDATQFERAKPLIQEGRQLFPDRIEYRFLEAVLYDKQGDLEKASAAYADTVRAFPGNADAVYRYAVSLERLKRQDEALDMMEKVLAQAPGNPDALNFVAYALAEQGRDLDRALDLITRALVVSPDNPYYIDTLAWVHFKRGDNKQAWAEIQRAVSKTVEDPAIYEHYGDIAAAMGNRKQAQAGYKKSLEMKPSNANEIKRKLDGLK